MEQNILSPINGNTTYCFESTDETSGIVSYLDYETGYTSNSKLAVGSKYVSDAEANQPKLVTELSIVDSLRDLKWYPSVINIPMKGMIFPMGSANQWHWEVMKVRDVTEAEKEQYPLPDGKEGFFKTILDVKGKMDFSRDNFIDALKEIGGAVDIVDSEDE
tara:strand:- start:699 stop:1181 length:483 start_codon:yes stop_codon:yes gene_type:complete